MSTQAEIDSLLEELKQEITRAGGKGDHFVEVFLRPGMTRLQERVDSKGEGWVCYPMDSTLKYANIQKYLHSLVPLGLEGSPKLTPNPLTKLIRQTESIADHNIEQLFKICGCRQDP